MAGQAKQRVQIAIDARHLTQIRACLAAMDCEDVTASPILVNWGVNGRSPTAQTFENLGARVAVAFTADLMAVAPLLATGLGIPAMELLSVRQTAIAA